VLFVNGPLELTAQDRVAPEGVAIRLTPPPGTGGQWADVWITRRDLVRWLRELTQARRRRLEDRRLADALARCPDGGHGLHDGLCPNQYCLCRQE
jgi:hypothetical protein